MRFNIPKDRSIQRSLRTFTSAEKTIFYFLVVVFISSSLLLLIKVNNQFRIEVPVEGGTLVEGGLNNPRFINPVLAISEADKNLTVLVYSGLTRITPEGEIWMEIAESIEVSTDELTYTAHIRPDAVFHDGMPVTAEDVVFTIQKIQDPLLKSPKRGNWDGIVVDVVNERTVSFTLSKPYAPFEENLTVGILPKHIWKNVSAEEFPFSQFNTLPIGSGPYRVMNVERDEGGIPNYYLLSPFETVSGRKPFIRNLAFKFYTSEDDLIKAYESGGIDSFGGFSPEHVSRLGGGSIVTSSPLPRIFALFFNQSESSVFRNDEVRRALDLASPKERIVEEVLNGQGIVTENPFPAGVFSWSEPSDSKSYDERLAEAIEILAEDGWKMNEETGVLEKKSGKSTIVLSFSISTGDVPELRQTAEVLQEAWRQLGAEVRVEVFESGDLNQNVIRPRSFDTLLFGEVVPRGGDIYPFWHSSQRTDPGLNIAQYANTAVDRLLEEARGTSDAEERANKYKEIEDEIREDLPAIFLYTPSYLYVLPSKVKGVEMGSLSVSQDRFLGIENWYIDTDKIWKIFTDTN